MLKAVEIGLEILDKIIPDPEQKAKAQLKLMALEQEGSLKEIEAKSQVVMAEAGSEHKLAAIWRPITMLMFAGIVANNYIIYPYLSLFWEAAPKLEVPPDLWDLLKIGLGGYVVGRSTEKAVRAWKK